MTRPVRVVVPGPPIPTGRPRVARGHAYMPARTRRYVAEVATAATRAMAGLETQEGPLSVAVVAIMPRPGRLRPQRYGDGAQWADRRPDLDNIIKSALDGSQRGGMMHDDGQVVELHAWQVYAGRGCEPALVVEARRAARLPLIRQIGAGVNRWLWARGWRHPWRSLVPVITRGSVKSTWKAQ